MTGALGALKGPLHGGAPGPVLDMLMEIRQQIARSLGFETKLHKAGGSWDLGIACTRCAIRARKC